MKTLLGTLLLALAASFPLTSPALAETPGPGWELTSQAYPTNLPPGGTGQIVINVLNVGAAASNGPVTVTDTLPPGLEATDAGELAGGNLGTGQPHVAHEFWDCSGTVVVTCTNDEAKLPSLAGGGGGVQTASSVEHTEIGTNYDPQIAIAVKVTGAPGVESNRVTIAGGGAPAPASTTEPITLSSTPPSRFGIVAWDGWFSNADGTIDTRAGSHPYAATFSLNFSTELGSRLGGGSYHLAGDQEVKNIEAVLPPGFIGDPSAAPQCTQVQLTNEKCPASSQIGLLNVVVSGGIDFIGRVYNMVPPSGVPAEFAVSIAGIITNFDASVRSGGDYGITEHINDIPRKNVLANVLTLWGVPSDPSHDRFHINSPGGCPEEHGKIVETLDGQCKPSSSSLRPFLTLPTSCGAPQPFSLRANTWQHEDAYTELATFFIHDGNGTPVGFTGCEKLGFGPLITTAPDTASADTPTGLTVEVKPPLGGLTEPEGLSPSDIENTTVTLPPGLVINPGQAAGLQACQASQARVGDGLDDAPTCPLASKIGVDEIETPLLPHSLKGNVYILQSNPPDLEMLVAASGEGVNLKLVGQVHLDEQTGRLVSTFNNTPALPFSNFRLSFSGGAQAALDTPTQCGAYTSSADFGPWSSPFVADFFTGSSFGVTGGPGNTPCPSSPMPFAPSMIAGAMTDQAGGFTDFSLLLQRGDGQQRIEKLQFRAPAGLSAMLSQIPLCPEPQAAHGTCSAASHVGHAVVTSGPGPYPLVLPQPGAPELPIYLTGSYKGAPFGLSIVTPVIAGPFNLGTIITRASIAVDPTTAQITVTTDPLPQVVKGVPTNLRQINSVIDRPNFMFNPTNCNPQSFSGTAWGTPPPGAGGSGATAAISSRFQVGSCRSLEFAPKFTVTTSGQTSKANGASLTAKVTYPSVPQGTEADIGYVKVELPKALPSRLTTLQKACTAAQFEANPAGCPSASFIGHAVVHTPLLPVALEGPAIFVSHGGEAFPSLTIVLQGDGVTVDLVGATFINKAGVTSTTFKTVPDAPFSTFELTLPQGPYSALTANENLCSTTKTVTSRKEVTVRVKGRRIKKTVVIRRTVSASLTMPYEFIGQNGAVIKQTAAIGVSGCAKAKAVKKKKAKSHKIKQGSDEAGHPRVGRARGDGNRFIG
jgi:hypothetical protein